METAATGLSDLYVKLYNRRPVVLPATDAELTALWQDCNKPVLLLNFASRLIPLEALVLATAQCVRLLGGARLEALPEGMATLDTAEKWAHGAASLAEVAAACERAMDVMEQADEIADESSDPAEQLAAEQRSELAYACASVAHIPGSGDFREDLDKACMHSIDDAWGYTDADHADSMRDLLPSPTLAQLRKYYAIAA